MSAIKNININELKELGRQILQCFVNTKVAFMFGSCSWEIYNSINKDSDLDLEIVITDYSINFSKGVFIEKHKAALNKGLDIAKRTNADVVLYRFVYEDINIMLHLVPQVNFEKLISLAAQNLPDGLYQFKELRNYQKTNPKYTCCSFTGRRKLVRTNCLRQDDDWYLMDLPLCKIENNLFYGGIFPEWHLTPPIVLTGDGYWLTKYTEKLFEGYVERLRLERIQNEDRLKFTNVLERKYMIPKHLLLSIDKKAEQKITFNKNRYERV